MHVESGQFNKGHAKEDLKIGAPANRAHSSEDVFVGVGFTWKMDAELLDDNSCNGQHANASVLDFGPAGIVQVSLNVRTVGKDSQNVQEVRF